MSADYDRSIHQNPDARAWAKFFCKTWPRWRRWRLNEEDMAGWFANAMMAMHDAGKGPLNGDHAEYLNKRK